MMDAEALPIGEDGQEIFACPGCSRPLARGSTRCPSCGVRLVSGVPLARAAGFVLVGLLAGLFAGAGGMFGYTALTARPATAPNPAPQVVPSAVPITGGTGNPGGATGAPSTGTVTALAASSLLQAGNVNVKLAEASIALRAALNSRDFDPAGTAAILRNMAADASFGSDLAGKIGDWQQGDALGADLATFYESVRAAARMGLAASVTNAPAYRQAAADMIRALGSLTSLDADARQLATSIGVDLPPLPAH